MGRWFNAAAVEWAMYESPPDLPSGTRWTLAMVASFAREDGRGAYPAVDTLRRLTGRSERTIRNDLDLLADRKLLWPGDRRLVARLRADRQPDVYDLSAEAREFIAVQRERGAVFAPRKSERGAKAAPRPASHGVQKTSPRGAKTAPKKNEEKNYSAPRSKRRAERLCSNGQPIAADGTCCPDHDAA